MFSVLILGQTSEFPLIETNCAYFYVRPDVVVEPTARNVTSLLIYDSLDVEIFDMRYFPKLFLQSCAVYSLRL